MNRPGRGVRQLAVAARAAGSSTDGRSPRGSATPPNAVAGWCRSGSGPAAGLGNARVRGEEWVRMHGAHAAELVLAAGCFAAALACSAGGWRALLPRGVSLVDACARFGCGSLANTFLPARAGDVVRLSLFGRVVPGGMLGVAGAVAAFGVARWLTVLPLGIGAAGSSLPPEAYAGPPPRSRSPSSSPAAPSRSCPAAAVIVRSDHARRTPRRLSLSPAPRSACPRPLSAALLVVPALEIAGTISVLPANLGVAEGARRARAPRARPADGAGASPQRSCCTRSRRQRASPSAAPAPACCCAVHRSCTASSPSVRPRCGKPRRH